MLTNTEGQGRLFAFDQPLAAVDVLNAFYANSHTVWMSRRDIARALGCAKSPTLIKRITECVEHGWLEAALFPMPNRVDAYIYKLAFRAEEIAQQID